jgi:transcriptional regulator with XRE-family HTH domain
MKERIIQFLRDMNLTSTKFADEIGVQRSSISHILSGRNKPSYDFIEKMLIAYPDTDAQWLITGKGNMLINQPSLFNQETIPNQNNLASGESSIPKTTYTKSIISKSEEISENNDKSPLNLQDLSKKTEKVMIFYTDGTFKEYKSE